MLIDEYSTFLAGQYSSAHSIDAFRFGAIRVLRHIADQQLTLNTLTVNFMADYAGHMIRQGRKPRSVQIFIISAQKFLNWLRDRGYVANLPVQTPVKLPKSNSLVKEEFTVRNMWQFQNLARQRPEPVATMLQIMPWTGLRLAELCQLTIESIQMRSDIGYCLLIKGKGNKERLIPMIDEVVTTLKNYETYRNQQPSSQWLFPKPQKPGEHLPERTIYEAVHRIGKKIGIQLSPHTMRHVFATKLADEGVNLEVIRELLGHESIQTTMIYVHASKTALRNAVDRFNRIAGQPEDK